MAEPQRTIMPSEQPPKVESCANRFELIARWGQPVDDAWAHSELAKWLANRKANDYDAVVETKGNHHG
jgi:hypothetical protein